MVDFNLTLIVQVLNFVCAYIVLKKFLWRPVIACMHEDEERVRILNAQLEQQRAVVREISVEKDRLWAQARAFFARPKALLVQKFDGKLRVSQSLVILPLVINEQVHTQLVDCVVAQVRHG